VSSEPLDLPTVPGYSNLVSPDGKRVVVIHSADRKPYLYDLTGKIRDPHPLRGPDNVWYQLMEFSPDGRRLATTVSDNIIRVWDCATGREVRSLGAGEDGPRPGYASRMVFSPDGRSLLLFDNELRIYEVASGQERVQLSQGAGGVLALAWSPDGRLVARGNQDGSVQVFVAATGKEIAKWEGRQGTVGSLAFSPDGRLLASGGGNGTILIWQVPAGEAPVETLSETRKAALWTDLIDADAGRGYRAVAALADAPGPTLALLKERLKARAAPPDPQRLEKLVAALDSDSFAEREKAAVELAEAGAAAEGVLRKALDKEVPTEVRLRVQELLNRIGRNGVIPERLRAVRAVEVLERIGTPAARQLLAELAKRLKDPDLEQDIQASLERLGERP
jgi:hypothetical protein